MFISSRLAYLELHKTGSQRISYLLKNICTDGAQSGYHNRLPKGFDDRYIVGSIRNPWDWYVSLWAYGCNAKGGLRVQLTNQSRLLKSYYKWLLFKPHQALAAISTAHKKPVSLYKSLYSDANNPTLFRQWLITILSPERRFDLGECYGFSPLQKVSGFLTFRYFKLYSRSQKKLFLTPFNTIRSLKRFDENHSLPNFVIRTENLEADFIEAITKASYVTSASQVDLIYDQKRVNASVHLETKDYYDSETRDLVLRKEQFIVDRFGYEPPDI